jgi:predicted porin
MKKTQVAVAALALVASTAVLADGVSAYGTVDVGAIAADTGRVQMVGSGNNSASVLGFRGTEDLGNGLKASFNYEAGINAKNGNLSNGGNQYSTLGLFNRVASVGLSTETYGITLGQQLSPFIAGELTGSTAVGGNGAFVPGLYVLNGGNLAGITTAATGGTGGFFVPDAVNVNASVAGFAVNVMNRMGGGGSAESNYNAASVGTTLADINVNYAYQKISTNGVNTTNNVISANYQFGDIRLNGAYASNSITGVDNKGSLIGASMPLNAAVSVGFTYARNSLSTLDNVRVASLEYRMSKQTYTYVNYAMFGNAAMGVYGNDQGRYAASSTESLIMVGLSHSF